MAIYKLEDMSRLMTEEEYSGQAVYIRSREARSLVAKLRGGTAQLRIEEGRLTKRRAHLYKLSYE